MAIKVIENWNQYLSDVLAIAGEVSNVPLNDLVPELAYDRNAATQDIPTNRITDSEGALIPYQIGIQRGTHL